MIQMLDRKVCRDRTAVAFLFEKKRRKISVEKYRINSRNILVCGTVRLQWGGGFSEGSFVAYPFYHLLEGGFLAVHEDAHAVDLAGYPYHADGGAVEDGQAEDFLP